MGNTAFYLWYKERKLKMDKKKYQDYIDEKAELICEVSDKIWSYAELSLQEFKS